MSILSDSTLHHRLQEIILEPDHSLVNPASIDIRLGKKLIFEDDSVYDLQEQGPYTMQPKEFVIVATMEYIMVPIDLVMDLKLKSTSARGGFNHSLAFHVDPGWSGILTMEVINEHRFRTKQLIYGQRFAQIILHQLDHPAQTPYQGRYQNATTVEGPKSS